MGKVTHEEAAVNAVRAKLKRLRARVEVLLADIQAAEEYLVFLERKAAERSSK